MKARALRPERSPEATGSSSRKQRFFESWAATTTRSTGTAVALRWQRTCRSGLLATRWSLNSRWASPSHVSDRASSPTALAAPTTSSRRHWRSATRSSSRTHTCSCTSCTPSRGQPERAAFRGLALPIFEDLGDLKGQAIALNNLGIEAYYDGEWALALDVYERSRALFERIGDVDNVAMAVNNIGEILSDQGRLDEAETLFRQVQETVDAAGHRGLSMMSRLNLGRAAARAGRFAEADGLLEEAAEGFREIRAASFEQEVHARIAEAAVLAGDHARALREVELAELSGESDPPPALRAALDRVRGFAYLQGDERDAAESEFEKSVAVARGSATLYELALSLRAQEILRGASVEDGEAQRLLDALEVISVPDVPTGSSSSEPDRAHATGSE